MISKLDDGTIEFAYFRPGATRITIAGDFNGWDPERNRMWKDAEGWWHTRLALPTGEFRFKYLVDDGIWEADFAAFGVEMDRRDGTWMSLLYVEPQTMPARHAEAA